ncbi:MAG: hypothetical protein HWE16_18205 [Gammaproteobacteria bacterium]|nr:hypothetical protein [Gammaproteobacteria bacterium]
MSIDEMLLNVLNGDDHRLFTLKQQLDTPHSFKKTYFSTDTLQVFDIIFGNLEFKTVSETIKSIQDVVGLTSTGQEVAITFSILNGILSQIILESESSFEPDEIKTYHYIELNENRNWIKTESRRLNNTFLELP